jgi:hypothetical protein
MKNKRYSRSLINKLKNPRLRFAFLILCFIELLLALAISMVIGVIVYRIYMNNSTNLYVEEDYQYLEEFAEMLVQDHNQLDIFLLSENIEMDDFSYQGNQREFTLYLKSDTENKLIERPSIKVIISKDTELVTERNYSSEDELLEAYQDSVFSKSCRIVAWISVICFIVLIFISLVFIIFRWHK